MWLWSPLLFPRLEAILSDRWRLRLLRLQLPLPPPLLLLVVRSSTKPFLEPSAEPLGNLSQGGASAAEEAAAAFAAALSALAAARLTTNPGKNTPVPVTVEAGKQHQLNETPKVSVRSNSG